MLRERERTRRSFKIRSQDFPRCAHLSYCLTAQEEDQAEAEDRATRAENRASDLVAQVKAANTWATLLHIFIDCFSS